MKLPSAVGYILIKALLKDREIHRNNQDVSYQLYIELPVSLNCDTSEKISDNNSKIEVVMRISGTKNRNSKTETLHLTTENFLV